MAAKEAGNKSINGHMMTKADGRKQCNNQPMTGESKSKAGVGGGGRVAVEWQWIHGGKGEAALQQ